jgi:hypothetical protein
MKSSRRHFLQKAATAGAVFGLGDLSFVKHLPRLAAAEAMLDQKIVRFHSHIEPLVRFLEATSRERLLEEVALRIHRGLTYQQLLAALFLAGIRNIQPRPVGFKFHSVLVVNSAHLASISSPESDRWLPIFWALDYFKSAQAQDEREGDWTMSAMDDARIPSPAKSKQAFLQAMDNWDEPGADLAVTGLARSAGAQELFEIFCRYGARDFREIGHKAIYVANAWRTLQSIGWQHAEPVLRSLAFGLLDRGGDENPAKSDLPADRPWRYNEGLAKTIRPEWQVGQPSQSASTELIESLRFCSADEAAEKVVSLLNRRIAPQSIWDGLFAGAGELLMRRPGLVSLHALTTTNAIHYAFQQSGNDETRRMLLLQNAAFLTLFRGNAAQLKNVRIDQMSSDRGKVPELADIFSEISHDRMEAAHQALSYLKQTQQPQEFINAARRLIFLKGNNSHDYKFSSAVLEDYQHISPGWRERFLASSVFNLRGAGDKDNELVKRTRAALS